ncbi:hypothetical protein SAMN06296273_2374 [Nitrosomonas ureae]|uniref:Uncharacterized protein n=1 Tax=Nitrosomonas ureae TaxID=44577 RepID=A0A285C067_9PROT|nr:hypothetical protein SAMN06296273_2374 [Nitrosomonas ureae]
MRFYSQLLSARSLVAGSVAIVIPESISAIVGTAGADALSIAVSARFTRCAEAWAAVKARERRAFAFLRNVRCRATGAIAVETRLDARFKTGDGMRCNALAGITFNFCQVHAVFYRCERNGDARSACAACTADAMDIIFGEFG